MSETFVFFVYWNGRTVFHQYLSIMDKNAFWLIFRTIALVCSTAAQLS